MHVNVNGCSNTAFSTENVRSVRHFSPRFPPMWAHQNQQWPEDPKQDVAFVYTGYEFPLAVWGGSFYWAKSPVHLFLFFWGCGFPKLWLAFSYRSNLGAILWVELVWDFAFKTSDLDLAGLKLILAHLMSLSMEHLRGPWYRECDDLCSSI